MDTTNRGPYGMNITDSCVSCKLRQSHWFCAFSAEALQPFDTASHISTYPRNAVLFVEGQKPRGAFVVCSGRVKLSVTSRGGKVLIVRMVESGEVLGLSAVISGTNYEVTAETLVPCQINFTECSVLLRLMKAHGEVGLHSAQALSTDSQTAYRDIYDLVLARSSSAKLARLLLSWVEDRDKNTVAGEIRVKNGATQEEMAQMIGASRETVTRLMSAMKKKKLLRGEGATLVIRDRMALQAMVP